MKNKYYLVVFIVISQFTFAQINKKYSVYLVFNSETDQMQVSEKRMSDSIWVKTFKFIKDISTENCKPALIVDNDGKLIKQKEIKSKTKNEERVILYHYSYRNQLVSINELNKDNIINYKDFMDSEFKSFNKVLKNASKIFIIDAKDIAENSKGYRAYEVVF